jgi:hypothetical protein
MLGYIEILKSTKRKFNRQVSALKHQNFVEMFGDPDPRRNKRWLEEHGRGLLHILCFLQTAVIPHILAPTFVVSRVASVLLLSA